MPMQQSMVKAVQDIMLEMMHTIENILSFDMFCNVPFEVTKHTPNLVDIQYIN